MDREHAFALIDAELAEASRGTSQLVTREDLWNALLDLRTAFDDAFTIRQLEADFKRKAQRRLR